MFCVFPESNNNKYIYAHTYLRLWGGQHDYSDDTEEVVTHSRSYSSQYLIITVRTQ